MKFRPQIEQAARRYNLDPDLVEAIVSKESDGQWFARRFEPGFYAKYLARNPLYDHRDPHEVSSSYGLMQVMFTTAIEIGFAGQPWELFDPAIALDLGCNYLMRLIVRASSKWRGPRDAVADDTILRSALAAYNGGGTGNEPDNLPDKNHEYADDVIARRDRIKRARAQGATA
jgi:soluble lytic murein transglycosylase-like protein